MIVLEQWTKGFAPHRLVVTLNGRIECQWRGELGEPWMPCYFEGHLPLFGQKKTRPPAAPKKSRPSTSRPASRRRP